MRRRWQLLLAAALAVVVLFAVPLQALAEEGAETTETEAGQEAQVSWDVLAGARVAMLTGAPFEDAVRAKCPDVGEMFYFASTPDLIVALKSDKVDAFINNELVGSLAVSRNEGMAVFPEPLEEYDMGIAFPKGSELTAQFADITERMRDDGTADALWDKWSSSDEEAKTVPEQDWPGANGTLKVAACASLEPVSYFADGQMLGYDIETLLIAAKELDVHLDFMPVEFSDLLASLQAGKADIGCGSILITEERSQAVDFATTHANNLVLIVDEDLLPADASATGDATQGLEIDSIEDLMGKRIGMVSGAAFDKLLLDNYEGISQEDFSYYNSIAELIGALEANKIDAFITDLPIGQLAVSRNTGIGMIPEPLLEDHYGFALQKNSPLTSQFNEVIANMCADGTIEELYQKWTGSDDSIKTVPDQDWPAPNGTLIVALNVEAEPSAYLVGKQPVGLAVEILLNIARELGYHLEFRSVSVPSLMAELQSGKADIAASTLSITEERKKVVDMTEPFYDGGVMAVVRTNAVASARESSFFERLANSFERTFITESRWKLVLSGLGVTVLVTLASGLLGTLLGFVLVLLRRRGNRIAAAIVNAFEGLMGRLPIVVVLMVFYYVIFGSIDISGVIVAIIVFTLAFGANAGAIMWNAVSAVDSGQSEASLALGFNDRETFFGVVLPQAARQFLPLLRGQLVSLTKDTSVVGYISVMDLTRAGDLIRSRTMEAFFPLIATAVIYFALCCLLAAGMGIIIRRFDLERRPRTIKGVEL